jgi:hypothetical protein
MKRWLFSLMFLAGLAGMAAPVAARPPVAARRPAAPVPVSADKLLGIWYCQQNQMVQGTVNQIGSILQLERNGRCRGAANVIITGMQMGQATEFTGTVEASGTWRLVGSQLEITAETIKIATKSLKMNGQPVKEPLVLQGFQSMLDQQAAKIRGQKRTVVILDCQTASAKLALGETTVTLTRQPR